MAGSPKGSACWRLMRLHQPAGIWLLLWPCWWSATLASPGFPTLPTLFLLAAGAVVMRGAGCIINDMADREFDRQVERTRSRPLASGELSMRQAAALLAILLALGAVVVLCLGAQAFLWAVFSLPLIVAYPFMKRITWWPQLFLGFTFNWGALVGWAAVQGEIGPPALLLYAGGVFWTLGYDTIYAHQDTRDDERAGIKSTARRLGGRTRKAVGGFYLAALLLWLVAGWQAGLSAAIVPGLIPAALQMGWQVCTLDIHDPQSCRKRFISNAQLGWLVLLSYLTGKWAGFT